MLWRMRRMVFYLILVVVVVGLVGLWLNPEWVIAHLRDTSPEVLYAVDVQAAYLALTIDDGPDERTTTKILDLLEKYQAKATFFLISSHIPGNEAVVARMVAEGHELGNHMTTDEASVRLPIETFEKDLLEADRALSRFGAVRWFRPGSGWYNEAMLTVAEKHGYRCVLGSVYPFDPQTGSAWFSQTYVLWKAKPGDIIVLHDHGVRGRRTVKVLESLLPTLKSRGFEWVTLSELWNLEENKE